MASWFSLEIVVEELKSYTDCKEFIIKSKFANVFSLRLKDPNDADPILTKGKELKKAKKAHAKSTKNVKEQVEQFIRFRSVTTTLITTMKNYSIELSLFSKYDPMHELGTSHIPWSPVFINYLYAVSAKQNVLPAHTNGRHNVFDEVTYSRIATINLDIKLTHLKRNPTPPCHGLFEPKQYILKNPRYVNHPSKAVASIIKEPHFICNETGTSTCNYTEKRTSKSFYRPKIHKKKVKEVMAVKEEKKSNVPSPKVASISNLKGLKEKCKIKPIKLGLAKSDTGLNEKRNDVVKTKSCSSLNTKEYNFLKYVFRERNGPKDTQVFCVNYFTVENDFSKETSSSKDNSSNASRKTQSSKKSDSQDRTQLDSKDKYKFNLCEDSCPNKTSNDNASNATSICSVDVPQDMAADIAVVKCKQQMCAEKSTRQLPPPIDKGITLDTTNIKNDCCTREEIIGGMQAKMKYDEDNCFCACECTFGFVKHTTYCGICGGFEGVGEDMPRKHLTAPFPCPVYHKLMDKTKKTVSNSESDKSKMKCGDSQRGSKRGSRSPSGKSPASGKASTEPDKDVASKRKRRDDRFKFNYGYTGIPPQIGHSKCAVPCTGTLGAVPKNMGWLWTADNIPGLKFRPMWKPGAAHKQVVRLLRMAKDPGIILAKKKKKDVGKKKRPLKRPLLTVAKKDGEYTVTMETMKVYPKQRALNQHPYEDKPVLTYTIGRTEEENQERRKKKEREQRRLEREQRKFIQSAFSDMCKEICLKTYQQALGLLPDAEDPDCTCYPKVPGAENTNLDISCSCSEDNVSFGSDTDSDEWIVEFTPPNATFDPTYKGKKISKSENGTQYTYLDYRVKLLDRCGNQVPRFFKGPDGNTQCSDLGGFWSPEHKWLEINGDGYIGPDEKWAPNIFTGPNGEHVDCDNGKFQIADGTWLVVGVDGYVDTTGNWKYYNKPKGQNTARKRPGVGMRATYKNNNKEIPYKSDTTWSCFGAVDPKDLSKLGILGHGQDKRLLLNALQDMLDHGIDVKIPQPPLVPRLPGYKKVKRKAPDYTEMARCKHPVPSEKGVLAVDDYGHKTYFKRKDYKSRKPHQRLADLADQGISLCSFHVPCLDSLLDAAMTKKKQYEKFLSTNVYKEREETKNVATQSRFKYTI